MQSIIKKSIFFFNYVRIKIYGVIYGIKLMQLYRRINDKKVKMSAFIFIKKTN